MSIKGCALPLLPQDEIITKISGGVQLKEEDGSLMPFSDFSLVSKTKIDNEKKRCNPLRRPVSNNQEWECLFKNCIDIDFILTVNLSKARDKKKRDHPLRKPIGNNEHWSAVKANLKNKLY